MKDLPKDRLATTDKTGRRIYLYPADVRGRFRNLRTRLYLVLSAVFFALPWLHVDGQQAVLLDLPGRRFTVFGLTLWAHDAPILLFIFLGAALTLFFVTAVFGRVWCGWACPQTVFLDLVFRRIERLLEGDSFQQRRFDQEPMGPRKFVIKAVKWTLFVAASLVISHTFLAYFTGSHELLEIIRRPPAENWASFLVMAFVAGITLFDFGWFREQFCVIACPYGRFQSVLMDRKSLAPLYDPIRGEPRRGTLGAVRNGDCVNCYRCVQVCPTGVDIRRGVQLECVACSACIDACDEVMTRIGKPKGLIRYDSEDGIDGKLPAGNRVFFSARSMVYLSILLAIAGGLGWTLFNRKPLEMTLTRAAEAPFIAGATTERGLELVNHFKVDFRNQSHHDLRVSVQPSEALRGRGVELVLPMNPLEVKAGTAARTDLFVRFTDRILELGKAPLLMDVTMEQLKTGKKESFPKEARLVGPLQ